MSTRSALWILAGCLALSLGVATVFVFDVPTNSILLVALALACPLAHLWMMRSGAHDHIHLGSSRPSAREDS